MFQIIPAIGTIIALAAFFFAVYYRTVQKYSQIGADSVKSIGELPTKSRLDATKVIVNVFDLDVDKLPPDKQFELALKTFEKRERESKRNFVLTLSGGGIMLIFAVFYWISQMDGPKMIGAALAADRNGTIAALNERGFYATSDTRLVDSLAKTAVVDTKIIDPFERAQKFVNMIASQPTVMELRTRAAQDLAPFQVAGDILAVSVPKRADQPPRYIAFVRRQSPLAGRLISIRARGRADNFLRLYAQPAIDSDSPADVQLNYEQFSEVFGFKPNGSANALITASAETETRDSTCPRYEGFAITSCDLPARIGMNNIPARLPR